MEAKEQSIHAQEQDSTMKWEREREAKAKEEAREEVREEAREVARDEGRSRSATVK